MRTNTHGYRMTGLKTASGDTKSLRSDRGEYVELFYDRNSGEVWTVYQVSLGQNTWTEYYDPNVIRICNYSSKRTMQEIADDIYAVMWELEGDTYKALRHIFGI